MENKDNQFSAQLKSEILKLMDSMIAFQKSYPKFNFPKTSENFSLSRELLEKGEFNLAVCGKVKNGKSSLINALIG
jgi:predicted GTPase